MLKKIKGNIVEYPLKFLEKENLEIKAFELSAYIVPKAAFT